ncbi:MAG TPA: transglycosylase domain-containing protein [Allosphingosinicella sp.]|nr:transglycosylase domain-containing protein [Allosphingosinicella sp.]
MTAEAIRDQGQPGDSGPPPVSRRARRVRMIKRGIKLFFLVFVLIIVWLTITAPLSRSLGNAEAPTLTILSAEGEPIARRGAIMGEPIDVTRLPPHVGLAFVAIEDRRFYYHSGVDPWGIGRAFFRNRTSSGLQGGSTITQQLAKTSFLSPDRTYTRKAQEALIALWLEARLTKNQILSRYLSNVYFGDNVYGLRAAARHYFNVDPEDLTLAQAAMLAGVVNLPSRLAPTTNPAAARRRAALVLNAMVECGFITDAQRRAVRPARVRLGPRDTTPTGTYFADWVMREASAGTDEDYGNRRIRTTLQGDLQRAAVRAVRRAGLGRTQAALVAMRLDGRVVAMVGGRDYAESPFNRATQARRQPGSAFKPFVYLAAFRAGYRPDTLVNDAPLRVGDWSPRNYDGHYRGAIPLRDAVAISSNSVAVQLSERVGRGAVIQAARDLGITTPLRADPSLPLGVNNVTLLELTAAYAGIASGRFPIRPYGLPEDAPSESRFRRDPHMPMMRDVLHAVVLRGTGRAANLSVPTFGKTGTTSDYRDALFVGFAGDLVVGVWVGNDDNSPLPGTSGGGAPARIWRAFMTEALGARSAPASPPVPLSQADRRDVNEAEPGNGLEPEPQPPVPQGPEPLIPEGNAITLPAPPREQPAPQQ